GTAVCRDRERVFPQRQPEQGEPRARSQASARATGARPAHREGRHRGRELPPGHDGAARARVRRGSREESARRLLLDLRIRPDRSAAARGGPPRDDASRGRPDWRAGGARTAPVSAGLGVAIADLATGMFAVQGILAALYAREKPRDSWQAGGGQRVDIAMLDAVTALLTYQASSAFATGATPVRMGNRHPSIAPYDTFSAADGDFVLSVGNDDPFRRACDVLGCAALASDDRFRTNQDRVRHYDALRAALAPRLRSWSRADLLRALTAAGVPGGAVRTVTEALADPQVAARE